MKPLDTELYREHSVNRWKKLFQEITDMVLDEYNRGGISRFELEEVLEWCDGFIAERINEVQKDGG